MSRPAPTRRGRDPPWSAKHSPRIPDPLTKGKPGARPREGHEHGDREDFKRHGEVEERDPEPDLNNRARPDSQLGAGGGAGPPP